MTLQQDMPTQRAVLLKASDAAIGDAQQVDVPYYTGQTGIYAEFIAPTSLELQIEAILVPLSEHLQSKIYIMHASSSADKISRANTLANTVLPISTITSKQITGDALLMYGEAGKDMLLDPDWRCLHDVCYESQLASLGGSKQSTSTAKELAEEYIRRLSNSHIPVCAEKDEAGDEVDDEDEAWTDEDVEAPDAGRKSESESEDNEDEQKSDASEQEEEEEEEESELESDDEDDPRKQALLDAIKQMILTDGQLDLDR
jgi:hypothetical protein